MVEKPDFSFYFRNYPVDSRVDKKLALLKRILTFSTFDIFNSTIERKLRKELNSYKHTIYYNYSFLSIITRHGVSRNC